MGFIITLGLDRLELDWGKNGVGIDHSKLFLPGDIRDVTYFYADNEREVKPGYDTRLKKYQGELEGKEEYTRVFLKLADRNSNYDFSKLEFLWSHLLKCCTSGSPV
jgi:hypothetical protein